MHCQLEKKHVEEIKDTSILPQTSFWGRVKSNQGFIPEGFELTVTKDLLTSHHDASTKKGDDLLVLLKYIDHTHCYAYVPYGPTLEPAFENQGVLLEEVSESIRPFLPPHCIFIRYDLTWQNQWAVEDEYYDHNGNWLGAPSSQIQEYRVNFKTSRWNLKKSVNDLLPKNTFFIDLRPNEQKLLRNMRYNTRYNIKKALRKGVNVQAYGMEHIHDWYSLYVETAIRHNLPLQSPEYFAHILAHQDPEKKGVTVKMLMADVDGEYLASMFLILSESRGTYLYGASADQKQDFMASYALQWKSMQIAKAWGCTEYDMFGSAPNVKQNHPLHGVHIYKKGFGGNLYHRMGCWDYPYQQKLYDVFRSQELGH